MHLMVQKSWTASTWVLDTSSSKAEHAEVY